MAFRGQLWGQKNILRNEADDHVLFRRFLRHLSFSWLRQVGLPAYNLRLLCLARKVLQLQSTTRLIIFASVPCIAFL